MHNRSHKGLPSLWQIGLGKMSAGVLSGHVVSHYLQKRDSHREQADTGRDTRSNGLLEKLDRGIVSDNTDGISSQDW